MAGPNLPVNIDTTYGEDVGDASQQLHQQHHDAVHAIVNELDTAIGTATDGDVLTYDSATGVYIPLANSANEFIWEGAWVTSTAYTANDVVSNLGSSYVCTSGHTSGASTEPGVGASWATVWDLLAEAGATGDTGDAGATGPAGPPGAQGVAGPVAEAVEIVAAAGTTLTCDAATASIYDITLDQSSCAITLDGPSPAAAITLLLRQGSGGSKLATWPNAIWPGGTAPTLTTTAARIDIVTFVKVQTADGPMWSGSTMGLNYTQGAAGYDTLSLAVLSTQPTVASTQTTDYVSASSYQLDDEAVGIAFVALARPGGVDDPVVPTFSGGGASSWTQGVTRVSGSADPRRRLTVFFARDVQTGSAAPFTVGIGGVSHSGCMVIVLQTGRAGADALTTALAKDVANNGISTTPAVTLGAEEAATSRPVACFMSNSPAQTWTAETDWTAITGATLTISNPWVKLGAYWRSDAWDGTAGITSSGSTIWAAIGTELEQT